MDLDGGEYHTYSTVHVDDGGYTGPDYPLRAGIPVLTDSHIAQTAEAHI